MVLNIKSVLAGAILGVAVFMVATYAIGFTAAIAMPKGLAEWALQNSLAALVLFLWDLVIVNLFGIGLLSFAAVFILVKFSSLNWKWIAAGFVIAETLVAYAELFLLSIRSPTPVGNLFLMLPHFLVVVICVFAAARLATKWKSKAEGE